EMARDRGRELPAEELGADVERLADQWHRRLSVGGARVLARGRDQALAVLARRLGEELLRPEAELARRLPDADLVAPVERAVPEREAELETGIAVVLLPALAGHVLGPVEERVDLDPHQRGRHDPERRERRVPTADRRLPREDRPEAALLREPLERRPRIGDRDELRAPAARLLPEVVGVRARLERRAGLRGRDEERPREVELRLELADRPRVRRVEDVEVRGVERAPQDLGREAGAAHPEQDDVVELLDDRVGELDELARLRTDARGLVEPAEPLLLAGRGPGGRVS